MKPQQELHFFFSVSEVCITLMDVLLFHTDMVFVFCGLQVLIEVTNECILTYRYFDYILSHQVHFTPHFSFISVLIK